jgi:hypothetical protein
MGSYCDSHHTRGEIPSVTTRGAAPSVAVATIRAASTAAAAIAIVPSSASASASTTTSADQKILSLKQAQVKEKGTKKLLDLPGYRELYTNSISEAVAPVQVSHRISLRTNRSLKSHMAMLIRGNGKRRD